MKFTVLIKGFPNPQLKSVLEGMMRDHDCSTCKDKDACALPHLQMDIHKWICMRSDDFNQIKKLIKFSFEKASEIILIDGPNDICHVYKAKGTMDEIKKHALPEALRIYEHLERTAICLSEIRDLRGIPIFIDPILN